ncbi:MAG: 50S ribosomal protein L3 [Candidatus Omnitrophota bacterium]|nr:MAG: 50S ribosomal protein L3 [Candidatus Omnitrophota bacterium]
MLKEIFGRKIGMTQVFNSEGDLVGVTLVEIEPACVLETIDYPTKRKVKIAFSKIEEKKLNKTKKPILGYFRKQSVSPYEYIREVNAEQDIKTKATVGVEIFSEGDIVDVRAKTKGKGFAGGMKRHGWHGQPSSHGSTTHRRIGSAGASTYPARIIKGLRMPGHMGNVYRTTKNLKIIKIIKGANLVCIQGSIPGSRGSLVQIKRMKIAQAPKEEKK